MKRLAVAVIVLGMLAGFFGLLGYRSPARAQTETPPPPCYTWSAQNNKIVLNVKFPGLPVINCIKSDGKAAEYAYIGTFGDYLVKFYQWFAGAAGVLAVFMMMFGGFQWLTAAGNAGRIGQAKETITGAIVGLILLLGSYVLLNTISPAFVAFKPLAPRHITGLAAGFATCYDNTVTSSGTSGSTGSGSGALTGTAGGNQCSAGGCSPLQNSTCASRGGQCGCEVVCQGDEVQVPFASCGSIGDNVIKGLVAVQGKALNPGDSTFLQYPPVTWGDLYNAYRQATGQSKIEKKGIADWLVAAGGLYAAGRSCAWILPRSPQAFVYICAAPATVLLMWNGLGALLPQDNELMVPGDPLICCQKKSDSTQCVLRGSTVTEPSSGAGTCTQDISFLYQPCKDSTTKCGEVNKSGTPVTVVQGVTQGCIGVACSAGQACILDHPQDQTPKAVYGGCASLYSEGSFYNYYFDPILPKSHPNTFDSSAACGTTTGTVSSGTPVGISCSGTGNCVFVNGYLYTNTGAKAKWYDSINYRTDGYQNPDWDRGTVQCYPNQ